MSTYDLVIIGTGPGGYVCAIRAAQLGLSVAVVEKRPTHGGTCLNVGCIPSKALLHASELYEEARRGFGRLGIIAEPRLDLAAMMAYKDEGVSSNIQGVEFLLKKNKIAVFRGVGRILAPGRVSATPEEGPTAILNARSIVIATGSDVMPLPGVRIDEQRILSSTGALELLQPPERLIVVGAGVIGLELGSVWRRLGSSVVVVEYLDRILPGLDGETAKQFQRVLARQGMEFRLGQKVTAAVEDGDGLSVTVEPSSGGEAQALRADAMLVAIGRSPYTTGLGLDEVGVALDGRGRVVVDARFKTGVDGIYAIGDVIAGPMLAHKAEDEGVALAEILAGQAGHVNYDVIPSVVYTFPEVASVGKTEEELKAAGVAYKAGKFPFTANGRARVMRAAEGFVKILADARTDRVLGVHIVGPDAGALIAEAAVLMEFGGSAEDLARTCHAHPTLSEAVKEAALAVEGRALHI
jgi:dihydrolipoamide dehydrogenase